MNNTLKKQRIQQSVLQISDELRDVINTSTELKEQINSARTKPKKDYIQKKLNKNNQQIMSMLSILDQYNALHKQLEGDASLGSIDEDNAIETE